MLNREQIKEILPHREPFLLLDEVIELSPGASCKARWTLTGEEYFFAGHFPGVPILPGVLMIESLAQAGAVALLSLDEYRGKIALFAGIESARFRRQVVPGDTLTLETTLDKFRFGVGSGTAVAMVGDEVAATAKLKFAVMADSK